MGVSLTHALQGAASLCALALSGFLGHTLLRGDRSLFLPGETSPGHHQIESRCELCHTEEFADAEAIQDACVGCHGEELRQVDDSHPRAKFTDPRNADRIAVLDARYCATCHREHVPGATADMGLTLPGDYCVHCHQSIGDERATHADLAYDSCAAAGCHNFHDNTALYEDFLVEHAAAPALLPALRLDVRPAPAVRPDALHLRDVDAPERVRAATSLKTLSTWSQAVHARAGVNCSDCHAPAGAPWTDPVDSSVCAECHEREHAEHARSRHGMRAAAGLEPMSPARARAPMREEAAERALDCTSCHSAHLFDTAFAATEACLECHADRHTLAFEGSPHEVWRPAPGAGDPDARITCATCHLPIVELGNGALHTLHDANALLRPNEKMAREVCLDCHGLRLTLDALADPLQIERSFRGPPQVHVSSVDWAIGRIDPNEPLLSEGSPE